MKREFWRFGSERFPQIPPEDRLEFKIYDFSGVAERWRPWTAPDAVQWVTGFVVELVLAGELNYRVMLRDRYDREMQRLNEARIRQQEREDEERQEERRRIEREKRQAIALLLQDAKNWERAATLRRYIAAAMDAHGVRNQEGREWAAWASSIADSLDLLTRHPEAARS